MSPPADTLDFGSAPLQLIPASHGKATRLAKGQHIRIINTHGGQVVDTWAFPTPMATDGGLEYMSMSHTRAFIDKVVPAVQDRLVTNHRRPILTLVEDCSTGPIHDTVIAACDIYRYQGLGVTDYHRNCSDNLHEALAEIGETDLAATHFTPDPFNTFMNIPIRERDHSVGWEPALAQKGEWLTLRAEIDCVFAMSACPQDIVPINGKGVVPREAHFVVGGTSS
jgi:uncharacterized protein YcgI (DUF1989 family)